jgi:hypothetical protein
LFYRIELGYYVTQVIGTRLTFPRGLDFLLERALPFLVNFVPDPDALQRNLGRCWSSQGSRSGNDCIKPDPNVFRVFLFVVISSRKSRIAKVKEIAEGKHLPQLSHLLFSSFSSREVLSLSHDFIEVSQHKPWTILHRFHFV